MADRPTQIDDILSSVNKGGGFALPNLYKVFLPTLSGKEDTNTLNYLCKSVQFPGRQILSQERRIGMNLEKLAYGYAVDDITLGFYVLNDYKTKTYFDDWMNLAIDNTTYQARYYNQYTKDVRIAQLIKSKSATLGSLGLGELAGDSKIGNVINDLLNNIKYNVKPENIAYEITLEHAYPTTMTSIDLSNELDGLVELQVQLSYKNWRETTPSKSSRDKSSITDTIGAIVNIAKNVF